MLNPETGTTWGSDPEAFFEANGTIIGSERLLPKQGISVRYAGRLIQDGVQFELNPGSSPSISQLGQNIARLLTTAANKAKQRGATLNFNGLVEVSIDELNTLSDKSRILGCMPSQNSYGNRPINVDPVLYRKRSSGGHIHMGLQNAALMQNRRKLAPLCDVFVGSVCTLVDRDPGAAERRLNYGRAGEYRLPDYGLEYRTTSNFWLRDYTLMDLTFGLANLAISVMTQLEAGDAEMRKDLARAININNVRYAIDTNNLTYAVPHFAQLMPFLRKYLPAQGFPLTPDNLDKFTSFTNIVQNKGIQLFFPTEDIVARWASGKQTSFADFLAGM